MDLLLAHLVRHGEDRAVSSDGRNQRQTNPCIARCALHDRSTGFETTSCDGILDDVDTDSVFHAAAGVEELDLAENDRLDPLCKVVESNKGSVPDSFENVFRVFDP